MEHLNIMIINQNKQRDRSQNFGNYLLNHALNNQNLVILITFSCKILFVTVLLPHKIECYTNKISKPK